MASSSSSPPSPQQLGTPEQKQLVAPAGWLKKIASTKSGGTPTRGAVYFIAPDGKEIKSKRSLEGYLKSNPGGPSVTEFDWSTGETPRRSSRLGVVTPVTSPESGAGNRRVRRKVAVEDEAAPEDDETVGAMAAKTEEVMEDVEELKERDVVETVEPVEKADSDINKEVEKIVGKPEDYKIDECVPEANTEEYKNVECASEAKTDEPQREESLSEVGMEGKQANAVVLEENGPEEELVKQKELRGEKVQAEEGKADKLQSVKEETPVEAASKEAKHDGEVTHTGDIGTLEAEDKQEGSEKWIIGLAQLSEAPEVPRPNGTSV